MDTLLEKLTKLELTLQDPRARRDAERVDAILHHAFVEFGRSGRTYDRTTIWKLLASEESAGRIASQNFKVALLSQGTALLTYRSAIVEKSGYAHRHTLRSSIYVDSPDGWRLRFHQGTPAEAFTVLAGNRGN